MRFGCRIGLYRLNLIEEKLLVFCLVTRIAVSCPVVWPISEYFLNGLLMIFTGPNHCVSDAPFYHFTW